MRAALAVLLLLPCLAEAQTPPAHETLLHLSATGTVAAPPDQLVAGLIAQSSAANPAEAQRRVNAQMAHGMQEAGAVHGIEAIALGYTVAPADDKQTKWTAQQTLQLRGKDGPALLDLAGRLQGQDFVTGELDWRLSPPAHAAAEADATTAALKALQTQATAAASALGLHVDYLKDVQIAPREFVPFRPMAMAARVAALPPQATASPQEVTVAASAEVVLR